MFVCNLTCIHLAAPIDLRQAAGFAYVSLRPEASSSAIGYEPNEADAGGQTILRFAVRAWIWPGGDQAEHRMAILLKTRKQWRACPSKKARSRGMNTACDMIRMRHSPHSSLHVT
jgi:hypothetical protein